MLQVPVTYNIKGIFTIERNKPHNSTYCIATLMSGVTVHRYSYNIFYLPELKNTIETQVNELKSQIESKCVMQ